MTEVCILILARGGSKGIPKKNMVEFMGQPLICHCISMALRVKGADSVWVSTDDPEIASASAAAGASVHRRIAATCTDTASSLSAVLEFLDDRPEVGTIALLQCTSPLTRATDVTTALARVLDGECDSVFALTRSSPGLLWRETGDGGLEPVNFDPCRRPRRQDLPTQLRESGNFYVTRAALVRSERQLQAGRRGFVEVPPETAVDIDTTSDLEVARLLARLTAPPPGSQGSTERSAARSQGSAEESPEGSTEGSAVESPDGSTERSDKRSAEVTGS